MNDDYEIARVLISISGITSRFVRKFARPTRIETIAGPLSARLLFGSADHLFADETVLEVMRDGFAIDLVIFDPSAQATLRVPIVKAIKGEDVAGSVAISELHLKRGDRILFQPGGDVKNGITPPASAT